MSVTGQHIHPQTYHRYHRLHRHPLSRLGHQSGATMITVLLVITLLTVLSGSFYQHSVVNELSTRNQMYTSKALVNANSGLRVGEAHIAKLDKRPDKYNPFSATVTIVDSNPNDDYGSKGKIGKGVWITDLSDYDIASNHSDLKWYKQDNTWWSANTNSVNSINSSTQQTYYVVEELHDADESLGETNRYSKGTASTVYYRVTARGVAGPEGKARATIQSTYSKAFD